MLRLLYSDITVECMFQKPMAFFSDDIVTLLNRYKEGKMGA